MTLGIIINDAHTAIAVVQLVLGTPHCSVCIFQLPIDGVLDFFRDGAGQRGPLLSRETVHMEHWRRDAKALVNRED